MHLSFSSEFEAGAASQPFFDSFPSRPAVFALVAAPRPGVVPAPYLGRTRDLRRRLVRLLSSPRRTSRMLNLSEMAGRIEYTPVGSAFEGLWLLYLLNRHYFPKEYQKRLRLKAPALLKLNLENRFPRCYPTRKMVRDHSLYLGPFPSPLAAEHFAGEFLDFFKIRRCFEDLAPDPSHPGCIYSQLHMCLAPCFVGCTDSEYQAEVGRVVEFLESGGKSLLRSLEVERAQASESLEFEQAAKVHHRIAKANEVLRQRGSLVRLLGALDAVMVLPGTETKSITFFRVLAGEIRGPVSLSFDENVPQPEPLDQRLRLLLDALDGGREPGSRPGLPPWEHLSLLARWYYSSFREGELVMLTPGQALPHARLIRVCRKLLAP